MLSAATRLIVEGEPTRIFDYCGAMILIGLIMPLSVKLLSQTWMQLTVLILRKILLLVVLIIPTMLSVAPGLSANEASY